MANQRLSPSRRPHWTYVGITVVIAAFLSLIPLPEAVQYAWPDWTTLVVFYWILILPKYLGVTFAWLNGLLEDVVHFAFLGQYALGMAFIGAVIVLGAHRLKQFNFIERMFILFILQSVHIAVVVFINYSAIETPILGVYWESALTTALVWPAVSFLLSYFDPNAS